MSMTPTIVPNQRLEMMVTGGNFRDMQLTTYSGRLVFGQAAALGVVMSRMEFTGLLPLPDSHSYESQHLADSVLSADFWVGSVGEYLFVPASEAQFIDDPRNPGKSWIHVGLTVQGFSGSIVGYQVRAMVGRLAIA